MEPPGLTTMHLLDQFGSKTLKFVVRYRARFLELIEFGNFVCHAVADDVAQFVARLLSLLRIALRRKDTERLGLAL